MRTLSSLALSGAVVAARPGTTVVRLEGRFRLKHPFYHKDDNNFAQASVLGYLEYDTAKKQFRSFHLVTEETSYGDKGPQPYGVAVRSVP